MGTYDAKMQAWQAFGMPAIEKLFQEYAELSLSLDEKEVSELLVGLTRLRPDVPDSIESAYGILEQFLAELIVGGRFKFREYGLSAIGQEQLCHLASLINPPAPVAPVDPKTEFADVIQVYNGPTHVLNQKMHTEPFRTRFQAAVAAGVI